MTTLFESLKPEAQNELIRDHVIELVTVVVRAVPDPDQPDDRLAMKVTAEVYDELAPGVPWIDAEMARIREICASAGEDISVPVQDALLVALNRRLKELDGLRNGKIGGYPVEYLSDPQVMEFLGPILKAVKAEVSLWCLAWTVAMDDDGKLLVDNEDYFTSPDSAIAVLNHFTESVYTEDRDGTTRKKVMARMRKVNDVVEGVVGGVDGE